MRTIYVNSYPHIAIVCTRDIEVGDEFLLDYGEAYNNAFLIPPPRTDNLPQDLVNSELPMGDCTIEENSDD